METIHLMGAEDVRSAGASISRSAETMRQTISYMDEILSRQQRFMDDWLLRLEQILNEPNNKPKGN